MNILKQRMIFQIYLFIYIFYTTGLYIVNWKMLSQHWGHSANAHWKTTLNSISKIGRERRICDSSEEVWAFSSLPESHPYFSSNLFRQTPFIVLGPIPTELESFISPQPYLHLRTRFSLFIFFSFAFLPVNVF